MNKPKKVNEITLEFLNKTPIINPHHERAIVIIYVIKIAFLLILGSSCFKTMKSLDSTPSTNGVPHLAQKS